LGRFKPLHRGKSELTFNQPQAPLRDIKRVGKNGEGLGNGATTQAKKSQIQKKNN